MTKPSTRKPTVLESVCGEFRSIINYTDLSITRETPYTEPETRTYPTMEALRAQRERIRATYQEMSQQSRED
jgi:hypothetical protein